MPTDAHDPTNLSAPVEVLLPMEGQMPETKFTPGPWSVDRNGLSGYGDNGNTFNICAGDGMIATLPSEFRLLDTDDANSAEYAEEEANARLIAAAPDLYAALADALATLREHNVHFDPGYAALARARGEQPC